MSFRMPKFVSISQFVLSRLIGTTQPEPEPEPER